MAPAAKATKQPAPDATGCRAREKKAVTIAKVVAATSTSTLASSMNCSAGSLSNAAASAPEATVRAANHHPDSVSTKPVTKEATIASISALPSSPVADRYSGRPHHLWQLMLCPAGARGYAGRHFMLLTRGPCERWES